MPTGTHTIADLLVMKNQTIIDYGLEAIATIVQREINAHNTVLALMTADLVENTLDRAGVSGASTDGQMIKVDQFARTQTQKGNEYSNVAFPLDKYEFAVGWTSDFFAMKTPADLAIAVQRVQRADILSIQLEIKRAIFGVANYAFTDTYKDGVTLNIKRFLNADGDVIPVSPVTGASFDGATHTHYDGSATLTAVALEALITDVIEHGHGQGVRVYINRAQEATVKALTGFAPLTDVRVVNPTTATVGVGSLDTTRLDNRLIGYFSGAEIWTKSWVPASYLFAFAAGDPSKPLKFRDHEAGALRGLRLAAELHTHPLHAQYFQRYFGLGVSTRTNGAALFIGNVTYVDPGL